MPGSLDFEEPNFKEEINNIKNHVKTQAHDTSLKQEEYTNIQRLVFCFSKKKIWNCSVLKIECFGREAKILFYDKKINYLKKTIDDKSCL